MAGFNSVITFPVQNINDEDTIQLLLEFTINDYEVGEDFDAEDIGLRVVSYGKLEMSYDIEDAFLVPARFSLTIGDLRGVLDNYFFGIGNYIHYQKQATVTIKINGTTKFIGTIIEDSIDYDTTTMQISFDSAPQTDVLNKRMIYDVDGSTPLNPFSLTQFTYVSIVTILEEIFQLVNPSISYPSTLNIIHDWEFQGKNDSGGAKLNDIEFDELYQLVDPLFFDNSYGISTVGDLLRRLALDWCCFAGFISYGQAFFKKLFHYSSDNLQTVTVYKWKKGYRYGLIDYVRLTTGIASENEPYEEGTFTELEDRYLEVKTLPGFWEGVGTSDSNIKAVVSRSIYYIFTVDGSAITFFPTEGDIYSHNGSQFTIIGILETNDATSKITAYISSGITTPSASGTLTRVSGEGDASISFSASASANGTYQVYKTRDPNINSNAFDDHGAIMAKFWLNYRGNIANCRVDKFIFKGINYDFLKDFNYSGSKYQPIGMTFNFTQNITECEAIYLGEL